MNKNWTEVHSKIFTQFCDELNNCKIKFFILRNYKTLPEINLSKDIDFMIDPKSLRKVIKIYKDILKSNKFEYYYQSDYAKVSCCYGINTIDNLSIHFDFIGEYVSKGYEVFTFDEMYKDVESYKNFFVASAYLEAITLFIYKQFNTKSYFKEIYKEQILNTFINNDKFNNHLKNLVGEKLSTKIIDKINDKDFDGMLKYSDELTKKLKNYVLKKRPIKTISKKIYFILEKISINTFKFKRLSKVFSVMAPDGAGKTTFLDNLSEKLAYYFVNSSVEERVSIYHFRPSILPNLGAVGEKAKVMKQDTDYSNPHRAKPAGKISSLVRITYYWFDYLIGYFILTRKDLKTYKFTLFDRYIYDFIVDPFRSRINLPTWVRKLYVKLTPQPKIVFYLHADPDVIYKRKQELTLEEIKRQNKIYLDLANSHDRFKILDANRRYDESVDEALEIILDIFCEKL